MAGNWQTEKQNEGKTASGKTGRTTVPVVQSRALLQGFSEVGIEHEGVLYRLRHTRQGKLILTK